MPSPMATLDLQEYDHERRQLLETVRALGYGTRADISRAFGISPATISGVLNGRIIDPKKLQMIADWIRRQ